ncbi:TPA: hypothetical protein J6M74_004663 [Escherichia coli]|nr:hypothetical protein [Escherichia coli]
MARSPALWQGIFSPPDGGKAAVHPAAPSAVLLPAANSHNFRPCAIGLPFILYSSMTLQHYLTWLS